MNTFLAVFRKIMIRIKLYIIISEFGLNQGGVIGDGEIFTQKYLTKNSAFNIINKLNFAKEELFCLFLFLPLWWNRQTQGT